MSTLNSNTPTPSNAREHAESSHDLQAILEKAIEQKSFGASLDGLKYRDVKALKSMINARMSAYAADTSQSEATRSGIRGKIGALLGLASKPKEYSHDDYMALHELGRTAFEVMLKKSREEFDAAGRKMDKVVDEIAPEWTDGKHISIGEINIAPTRRNHGHIQVGYEQSPEEMRDFIVAHIDDSRKINSQIAKEIAAINEGREITFFLSDFSISSGAHRAKEDIELENQVPLKSLDIDDAIARMRELAATDNVKDLPKGTRIDISSHNGAYYGYDRELVIVLNGMESASQNKAWIKEALRKHKNRDLLVEEADRAVKDADGLVERVDETAADFQALDAELGKITGEPPYYPGA